MKSNSQPIKAEGEVIKANRGGNGKKPLSVYDVVLFGLLAGFLLAGQVALAHFVPNLEVVTPLLVVYTKRFGAKTFFPLYAFIVVEGIIYGFHIWWIAYLYVWAILVGVCLLFKKIDSALFFAVIAAIYGLIFGTLTSLPYLVNGFSAFIATVISGISFDLTHFISNFFTTLILYRPLIMVFKEADRLRLSRRK